MIKLRSCVPESLLALGILLGALACMPCAEAVTPRQLVEVADLANLVMSPDGRSVAFRVEQANIEQNTIETAWYVQDVSGALPPRRVANGGYAMQEFWGLPASSPAVWSPDGRWIYYRAMINGKVDVWRAAADGSRAEPVTLDPADVREFALSADGHVLKYSVGATRGQVITAEQAEYDNGVRVDKTVPIGQPLFRSGYITGRLATQRYRGGKELDRASLLAGVADRWKAIDLVTGQRRDFASTEAPLRPRTASVLPKDQAEPIDLAVDPHADRMAVLTGSGDGRGLYRQPYAELAVLTSDKDWQPIKCRLERCTNKAITNVQWRPQSDEVLFTITDPGEGLAQSIFRWNFVTNVIHTVVQSRGLINGGREERSSCGVSVQVLVCVAAEADRPPRLERVDLETGQRQVLFDPNSALASDMLAGAPARLIRWKDPNGHTITGQFFAAHDTGKRAPPLFVNYYSCSGFVRGGFGDEWPLASLAENGIAALCINHAPLQLDAVARYSQGLTAVRSAVDLLSSAGEIDRTRVGMGGLSFGAEVTLWTVANSHLLTAASVSSIGQSPLGYALRRMYDDNFLPALRKYWQLGPPEETPKRWRKLSLVFSMNRIRAPIMMQLPEHEYMLTIDYAVPLIKDSLAELYVFPDEAHNKFQPRHKLAVYQRNLDWFKFWLLDEENAEPAKRKQYARWRQMKARVARAEGTDSKPTQ